MQILDRVPNLVPKNYAEQHYMSCLYPISTHLEKSIRNMLLPGSNAILFSGGWRFKWSNINVEPLQYKGHTPRSETKTIFVDPSNSTFLNFALKKIKSSNLIIFNTAIVLMYRPWQEILAYIHNIKPFAKQVIITLPFERFDWNRCKYSPAQQADLLGAKIIDQTFVIKIKQ